MDLWGLYVTALKIQIPKPSPEPERSWQDNEEDDEPMIDFRDVWEENSSDEDTTSIGAHIEQTPSRSDQGQIRRFPSLILSPLFSYFAMLVLKLPITLAEIYEHSPTVKYSNHRWIMSGQIPFLQPQRLIPPEMLLRLNSETQLRFAVIVLSFTFSLTSGQTSSKTVTLLGSPICCIL
jgi:hypothetical protein